MEEEIEQACRKYIHENHVTPFSLANFIKNLNNDYNLNKNISNNTIFILSKNLCNKNQHMNTNDVIKLIKKINNFCIII